MRGPSAHTPRLDAAPADPIKSLLCLTDACLLWLYSYFCDEQAIGRVRGTPYQESSSLREHVRKLWETEARVAADTESRERASAMVGLMYVLFSIVFKTCTDSTGSC